MSKKTKPPVIAPGQEFIMSGDVYLYAELEDGIRIRKLGKVSSGGKTEKVFVPPTKEEVVKFFTDNGYRPEAGEHAWNYYEDNDWKDSHNKPVLAWKQKMRGNQMHDRDKVNEPVKGTDNSQMRGMVI